MAAGGQRCAGVLPRCGPGPPPDPVRLQRPRRCCAAASFAARPARVPTWAGWSAAWCTSSPFYDCCAELGLLVWQDAMLATSFDPPRELDDVIARWVTTLLAAALGNPHWRCSSGGSETLQRPDARHPGRNRTRCPGDRSGPAGRRRAWRCRLRPVSPAPPDGSDHLAIRRIGVCTGSVSAVICVRSPILRSGRRSLRTAGAWRSPTRHRPPRSGALSAAGPDTIRTGRPACRGSWRVLGFRGTSATSTCAKVFGVDPLAVRRRPRALSAVGPDGRRAEPWAVFLVLAAAGFPLRRRPGAVVRVTNARGGLGSTRRRRCAQGRARRAQRGCGNRSASPSAMPGRRCPHRPATNDSGTDIGGELRLQATDVRGSVVVDAKTVACWCRHSARTWFDHEITSEFGISRARSDSAPRWSTASTSVGGSARRPVGQGVW